MRQFVSCVLSLVLAAAPVPAQLGTIFGFGDGHFEPKHRLVGIGVDRERLSDEQLAHRVDLMVASQTFTILRDPRALAGAQRIMSPKLQAIFERASEQSGLPASLISAVSFLESWGDPTIVSPAGPKGIMQISEATARSMGLRVSHVTKYKISREKRASKGRNGRAVFRTVSVRTPYSVVTRDERLMPELAIPAAGSYLARMERKFGGRDWAVFAYHCGEGCAGEVQGLVQRYIGSNKALTVANAFFNSTPGHFRDLYETIKHHMDRDWSPTYYFRIMRAEQLLALYKKDPKSFEALAEEYRNQVDPQQRASHRLTVWVRPHELVYNSCEDLRKASGSKLVKAMDDPKFFGFSFRTTGSGAIGEADLANQSYYLQATPAALGTLAYIAYETRRLFDDVKPKGEKFVPLEVTSLVRTREYELKLPASTISKDELPAHCSGQVFDISYSNLSSAQREILNFILDDLGYGGYLGFVQETGNTNTMHIGASPAAREFFTQVFQEAIAHKR